MAVHRFGQATLPVILVISAVIAEIALAFIFISYFSSTSGLSERLSVRAESAALAGIRDILIKIARNKDLLAPTCFTLTYYTITVDGNAVDIYYCQSQDPPLSPNCPNDCRWVYTVLSRASSLSQKKQFNAIIVVDQLTGVIQVQSIKDVPYTPPT